MLPTTLSPTDSWLTFCFSWKWHLSGFQTLPVKSGWKSGVCDPDSRPVLFLWDSSPDLWSTQRCLRSQVESKWFPKHKFEIHISCVEMTDLLMQCPHWLSSQDLIADMLNLNVVKVGWMRIQVSLFLLSAVKVKLIQSCSLNQDQHVYCSWLGAQIQSWFCAGTVTFPWCADSDFAYKLNSTWNPTQQTKWRWPLFLKQDLKITTIKVSRLVLRIAGWILVCGWA